MVLLWRINVQLPSDYYSHWWFGLVWRFGGDVPFAIYKNQALKSPHHQSKPPIQGSGNMRNPERETRGKTGIKQLGKGKALGQCKQWTSPETLTNQTRYESHLNLSSEGINPNWTPTCERQGQKLHSRWIQTFNKLPSLHKPLMAG